MKGASCSARQWGPGGRESQVRVWKGGGQRDGRMELPWRLPSKKRKWRRPRCQGAESRRGALPCGQVTVDLAGEGLGFGSGSRCPFCQGSLPFPLAGGLCQGGIQI